jgi:16S rRNA (cytidine1402-2'-O)-methyltransferase
MPLTVCATPIGNLEDVSPRLLSTLRAANLICAEDTRHSQRLLARYEISTPLTSCHEHTSPAKIEALVKRLEAGELLALVTDAGTPGVSDPGPVLVRAAAARGIEVLPIPGPCALVAALSISGFDAQRFSFLGFLPRKPGKRKKALLEALSRVETFELYESPYRVIAVLETLAVIAPEADLVVCRELTKQFEETLRGTAGEVLSSLKSRKEVRGEFVLVIGKTVPLTFEGVEFSDEEGDEEIASEEFPDEESADAPDAEHNSD